MAASRHPDAILVDTQRVFQTGLSCLELMHGGAQILQYLVKAQVAL